MLIKNKILKESMLYSLSGFITQIINLLTLVFLMRYISKENLGYYFYILEFIAIFAILAENGYRSYFIRELSQSKDKVNLLKSLQFAQLNIIIIVYLGTLLISYFFMYDKFLIITTVAFGVTMVNFFTPMNAYIISNSYKKLIFYKDIFIAIGRFGYFSVGIFYEMNVDYFLYFPFFQFGLLLFYWIVIKTYNINYLFLMNIDFLKSKSIIIYGFSFTILVVLNLLYNKVDILMLESMKGYIDVADYTSATKFLYPMMFFSYVFMLSVFPKLSKEHNNKHNFSIIQSYAIKLIGIWGLVLSIIAYIGIDYFYKYLFIMSYENSLLVYKILLPYIPIVFMYGIITNAIVAKHDTTFLVKVNAAFLLLNIILNIYFIQEYASIGAAISTMICELFIFIVVYFYGLKKYHFIYPNKTIYTIWFIIFLYYINIYRIEL